MQTITKIFSFCLVDTVSGTDVPLLNESNITCSLNFYLENFTCLPECLEWDEYPNEESAIVTASVVCAAMVASFGLIGVIIGTIIRHKSM